MASGRYTAYFLHAGRPGETHSGQTSGSIGDLQSKRTVLYQNDLYAGYKRILYICRAHTSRRSHRIMECLRESRRNCLPQGAAHRNHQAEPSEDYAGFANHPSGFEQRRICPAYFFMADGSHRIATESKGRNVLIESQYAVQELRTIPVQQSGNGLYDRPGGCVQRGTGWGRKSRRQHTASGSNGCSGYAECNAHHPCLRTGRRCKHLLADCSLLSVHIVCGHQSEPAERKVYRNRQRSCV